jgi:hypothetical protein
MDNEILSRVEHETFLDLELDENLRWYPLCRKAAVKIGRSSASMRKVKQFVGTHALKTMYNSMILPHLSYCIAAWGGTFDKATKRMKVQQKKAIRIITKARAMEHTEPRLKKLETLKLEDLYKYHVGNLVYDCLNGHAPQLMNTLFTKKSKTCTTQTRGEQDKPKNVQFIKGKVSSLKRSFPCREAEVWNELPVEIQAILKKSKLKSALKKTLFMAMRKELSALTHTVLT